ncbi:hypothetical protein REPUB_Repub18cG0158500 [Reevesia pubescens]
MKRRVVEWLFFIICCNIALLYSLSESAFISSETAARHNRLKPVIKEKQLKNERSNFKGLHEALYLRRDVKEEEEEEEKKVIIDENKKGKGSYGGGDLLRPRSKKSGANSLLLNSLLRHVTVGSLAIMFFF